ncbi:MAG: N-acetylglucosamine-6-phosphate deacetylase [Fusobacteriaceae bacterium]|jgi:N-acetylglucosamine-6-phosphate deacetylase|nr:N-acetylglucosamine-6-phosphate deacetylase [Fusobacteriaceae bacterium]MBP9596376.1 N-acetylglucosamine-6-phosphate deacetylase [Fusobacteriaceae bacterium]
MYALINGEIYTGEGIVKNKAIIIDGNRVEALVDEIPKDIKVIDLQGKIVAPAFIDLQLNGCGGVLFNDEISLDTLRVMNETNIKTGTTSYLPTLITTTDENIEKALKLVEENENLEEIGVLGLHIEGPYISIPKKGIHNPAYIRVMSDEIIHKIAKFGSKVTKIMTIAPENAKVEHLKELKDSGINLSIGHTNATYEEALEKVEYFKMATHLFNAMSSFTSREPGVIGAIFENKSLYTGIIVDGVHSHYGSVKIAKDILKEKLFLVTDAVAPVGTNMESFMFEGNKVLYKDGKCISPDGTLGGSALTMIEGVQNLVKHVGVSLEEALFMASTYPAKAIRVDDKYGYIKEGYIADLVVLDKELNISNMIVKGEYK